jgi:hypothetical protein
MPDFNGGFYLYGNMSGGVIGINNKKVLTNYKYKNLWFYQTFDLSVSQEWANWIGDFSFNNNSKGVVLGSGSLTFGNINDPVDTVAQNVKGTFSKAGVYSWATTSVSKGDSKVKLTIKHDSSLQLIDGKNTITAAAQSRKF